MKKRFLSLVLCLVMVFSLFPAFDMSAAAADPVDYGANGVITNPDPAQGANDNLHLTKTLAPGANGTYDITMESWATGEVKTHVYNEQIPTDYVLIADQSGSMNTQDVPVAFSPNGTTKDWKISDGANVYYYKETDANGVDHYYRVYRKRGDLFEFHDKDTVYVGNALNNLRWFQSETVQDKGAASQYWYNPSLDDSGKPAGNTSDNHMYPVRVSSKGATLNYWIRFRFTDLNGNEYNLRYPDQPWYKGPGGNYFTPDSPRWGGVISYDFANRTCKRLSDYDDTHYTYAEIGIGSFKVSTGMYVRQILFTRHPGYSQLAYKDDNGVEHLLIDATYCNSSGNAVGGQCGANGVPSQNHKSATEAYWHGTLYTATQNVSRLDALKGAMTEFVNTVSTQENEDGSKPNHRVAIVGFAGSSDSNTELLTGINLNTSASNKTGIRYSRLDTDDYKEALLDVTDSAQLSKLNNAVQALDASGGTEGQYGLYMAKNILDNRELTKFDTKGGKEVDRLTIIVYFTDGTPGNYDNDNQYAYGNEVVDAAHQIKTDSKIPNAEIYSIGTFGFADSEPLVYEKYTGNNDEYKFDPDYVKTLPGTWNSGYMYRLWLRNTQGYGDVATDTVYDYMRTITTEFKGATQFVDPSWYGTGTKSDNGVYTDMVNRVRGDSNGLRRYFLATDLSALSRVFITIGSEEASSSSTVTLNDQATLQDKVNLTYFDVANASTEAYTVVANKDGTFGTSKVQTLNAPLDKDTGVVTVSGFDYSTKYVTSLQDGEKLVVKIKGLTAKQPGTNMPSNDGNAFIKAKDAEANAIEIGSPTLTLTPKPQTYVMEYNAKTKVAKDVTKVTEQTHVNGAFTQPENSTDFFYQLSSGKQNGEMTNNEYRATINSAYTAVDTATVYGTLVNVENDAPGWKQITTVPASAVYYDDSFTETNAQVLDHPGDTVAQTGTFNGSNSHIFTFYGTGIDVYCTTHDNGGYVSAALYQGTSTIGTPYKTITVKNQSKGDYCNTPTIHFTDLDPAAVYTVWLYANSGAQYKIDGVRVYHPVKATDNGETTEAAAELAKTDEANANYFNLHDLLLNASSTFDALSKEQYGELTGEEAANVSGILYLDNANAICMESNDAEGNAQKIFNSEFDLYQNNSPINEIYLQNGQGVAFKLANWPLTGEKVYLGVSAPKGKGSGTVIINGHNKPISSSVDQYYDITEWIATEGATKGVVSIKTPANMDLISITNLKITRVTTEAITGQNPPADAANDGNKLNSYRRLAFAPMTTSTVEEIAEETVPELFVTEPDPEPTGEPDPTPTPTPTPEPTPAPSAEPTQQPSMRDIARQIISNFVNSLFGSISRLFGH